MSYNHRQCPLRNACLGIIFLLVTPFFNANGQSNNRIHYDINWLPPVKEKLTDKETVQVLKFEKGVYRLGNDLYPRMVITLPNTFNGYNVNAEITGAVFESLKPEESSAIRYDIPDDIQVSTQIIKEPRQSQLIITLLPLRKSLQTNTVEKLLSFDLELKQGTPITTSAVIPRVYAANSVLSTGKWYKLALTHNGVYKINYSFLLSLGIDPSTVSFQNLRLFGNGGGMVPQHNLTPRPDDLTENAIKIVDVNNDGSFNTDDYFLFYGEDPHQWTFDTDKRYHHKKNLYSDSTYYFLNTDGSIASPAKRITSVASLSVTPDLNITSFTDYDFHEEDLQNFIKSGREWYGEIFNVNLSQRFTFNFPNLIPGNAYLKSSVEARTVTASPGAGNSLFRIVKDGSTLLTHTVPSVSADYLADHGVPRTDSTSFSAASPLINLDYNFVPYNSTASGWLNYIELNVKRELVLSANQFFFRDHDLTGSVTNRNYIIDNAKTGLTLWNTSDPASINEQQFILSGSQLNFVQQLAASAHAEYVLFDANSYYTPSVSGKVENQNLHASAQTDMIIVTHPDFLPEALRLAEFHKTNDNLKVVVATTEQVYNEFGSGAQDISAIRDFAKMFYDRGWASAALDTPRYLLLFGDGSYDPKFRISGNTNFVPTYESENSTSLLLSYTSDDFFGMLGDNEGLLYGSELMDLGVGRFPVKNLEESKSMVDKVITYSTPGSITDLTYCAGTNQTRLGDWRNMLCFIADDGNYGLHLRQTEDIIVYGKVIDHPEYNIDKIYFDAYKEVSTPGGLRYPEVNDGINRRIEKGALLMNYTGHGGEIGWADEGVLNISMINSWRNANKLPAFITATCEFSRYDDPQRTSAGELVLLNKGGGGICLFTTTRLALSGDNQSLNTSLLKFMFTPLNGEMPRIGDVMRLTKRENSSLHSLALLGDPALRLAYPEHKVSTTSIKETATGLDADTISALSKITITGTVTDNNGQTLTNFNGVVYPTIYDKISDVNTLGNNAESPVIAFKLRKNILYRGKASVVNGVFSTTFIVPKDISYQYGKGRLSYYAHNGVTDANGYEEDFYIGGVSNTALNDNQGPGIKLFLNDDKFVFGGMTDQSPKVFAMLTDSSGINTVGNGIGHDMTATLDKNPRQLFVLNDYYESDLDNYQKGRVLYSLNELSPGRHSIQFKAWDINNNSSEAYTEFVVAESAKLALDHVLNYPNPFTTHTTFMFEHNKPCTSMTIQVQVFTVSGKLIKTLDNYMINDGYRNTSVSWDGRDDFGDPIGKGVYVYRLKVKTADGEVADKFEKLVILK